MSSITETAQALVAATLAGSIADVSVRGQIMAPGTWRPSVNGEPAELVVPPEVIEAAYKDLAAALRAGAHIPMRLSHPGTDDMPILYGHALEVKYDPKTRAAWLTKSQHLPELERLMTAEAWQKLPTLGLSIFGPLQAERQEDGRLLAKRITVQAIDIVSEGASPDSWISTSLPPGLVAARKLTLIQPPGTARLQAQHPKGDPNHMPKLESVDQIPEDVRQQLSSEQQEAYLAAYNAAIEAGNTPQEAHAMAMEQAGSVAATSDDDPKKDDKEKKDMSAKLAAAQTEARNARDRVKQLEAQLAAKTSSEQELAAKVAQHSEFIQTLQAEKADREARDDVEWAIVRARRAAPAERETLLMARKAMGGEGFRKMIQARGYAIPAGEKGVSPEEAGAPDTAEAQRAQRLYEAQKGNVDAIVAAGLHKNEAMMSLLQARHADHPKIKRLTAAAAAAAGALKAGDS